MTAEVVLPEGEANGVIVAQGGAFGGWSLYVKDGRLKYCYNLLGIRRFYTEADRRCRRASTRCAWSSPMTAAGWPRAATSRSTWTAARSARGVSTSPSR